MEILGVVLGLVTLIILSFAGWGMIPTALAAAFVVIFTNGMGIWDALSVSFAGAMQNYVGTYMILFFLGTTFGGIMSASGAAKSISLKLLDTLGKGKSILVVVLASAILSYGGINLFVIVFTIYPIALVLFKEEDISKELFPAAMFLGCATFTMVSLPGTPAVQNIIPTTYFGTTAYAAPVLGIIVSIFMFAIGYMFLRYSQKRLQKKGVHFVPGVKDDLDAIDISKREGLPNWFVSVLPILIILVIIFALKDRFASLVGVNIALFVGILISLVLYRESFGFKKILPTVNESATNSVISLINTAVIVGFGGVVQASEGFNKIVDFALSFDMSPLISGSLAVGTVAAACGSCSGGLTIFMDALGTTYLNLATQAGISPEVLHRVFCLAGAGLDSLPHSGAFITTIIVAGLTHKESYKYFFVTNIVVTSLGCVLAIILYTAFGIV